MQKHTPGEWTFEPENGDKFATVKAADGTQSGQLIAVLKYQSTEQSNANAKLIAAAPDMLKALMEIRSIELSNFRDKKYDDLFKSIDMAIAKATE